MAASNAVVPMVRVLAIIHIGVGAFLIIFGIFDAAVQHGTLIRFICLPVVFGLWTCIAGGLGIPASSPQRTSNRNCFAGVFMGFSIVSAACGGVIIIGYGFMVAFEKELALGLAAVILILGIIEFGTGIWVSICLCLMKPCCKDSEQQVVAFTSSIPGNAVTHGVDFPLQAYGVTVQAQPYYGYTQAGQITGGPVPFQPAGNQPHLGVANSPGGGLLQQDADKAQEPT